MAEDGFYRPTRELGFTTEQLEHRKKLTDAIVHNLKLIRERHLAERICGVGREAGKDQGGI